MSRLKFLHVYYYEGYQVRFCNYQLRNEFLGAISYKRKGYILLAQRGDGKLSVH